jgi:hypothetical protein
MAAVVSLVRPKVKSRDRYAAAEGKSVDQLRTENRLLMASLCID